MEKFYSRTREELGTLLNRFGTPKNSDRKEINALRGNSYWDFERYWHGSQIQNENTIKYISDTLIPKLAKDAPKNNFRLAVALSFTDSRTLNPQVRRSLGLPEEFEYDENQDILSHNPPRLMSPDDGLRWISQCGDANSRLRYTHYRMEGLLDTDPDFTSQESMAFELAGCLMGKINGHISGLCFETNEFPNGSVFLKDIWYELRDSDTKQMLSDLARKAHIDPNSNYESLYTDEEDPVLTKDLVVWNGCGGTWQPTRSVFYTGKFRDTRLDVRDF